MKGSMSESLCLILLLLHQISVSRAESFEVLGPSEPIVAVGGEDIVLPCYLKPSISAEDMRVEWSRVPSTGSVVHNYQERQIRNENQIPSYRGRTALFPEELKRGNASLRLTGVRASDEGRYQCYIQSKLWYDDASVELQIKGTEPVISMEVPHRAGWVSLLCESKGWDIQPDLVWLDSEGHSLPAAATETHRGSEDLYTVRRRIIIQDRDTNTVTCRVHLQELNLEKDTVLTITAEMLPVRRWKASLAVFLPLAAAVALVGCVLSIFHSKKLHRDRGNKLRARVQVNENGSSSTLEVAALGRPFQLGMLYDCRTDCLIPGITLWNNKALHKDTVETSQHNTEFEIIASDSIEDKSSALNVNSSLKASFLGGLVEAKGSGQYLKDTKVSKKQARVTLRYKTTTKFMQMSMNHLGRGNVKYPYVFEEGKATHVVTAILYGAQAFFVFDREVSENEDRQNIEGNLQVMIKKIPALAIEGEGSLKMTDSDSASVEKFSCKFYGDFYLDVNPVSFQDAIKVYTMLPKMLGEEGEHAVPVQVWLYPLKNLDSTAAQIVREISVGLVTQTQNVLEDFDQLQMRCNDLLKDEVITHFPETGKKLKLFKDICLQYRWEFQKSVAGILPSIRGGGREEGVLADLLREKEASPFNGNKLHEWLDCKEKEVTVLQTYTRKLKGIKLVSSKSELDKEILNTEAKHVVCFALTSVENKEQYLSVLSDYLKESPILKLAHNSSAQQHMKMEQWCFSKHALDRIREQMKLFVDFSEANRDNVNTSFIAASVHNQNYEGASIYLYEEGSKKNDHFEPPSEPEKPAASDTTHDSVTVVFGHPMYGSKEVTHYLTEYRARDTDTWQAVSTPTADPVYTVSGLLPHTEYQFRCRAVCPVGVSPVSEESSSVKTLPTNPPGAPYLTDDDATEFTINWQKPTEIGNGVGIDHYIVEYRNISENQEITAKWTDKTCKGESCRVPGLQPDAKYEVRVSCDCGAAGKSRESEKIAISVTTRLAERIKQRIEKNHPSKRLENSGKLNIYQVPLQETDIGLKDCKKYIFGKENKKENRTIMVVGATGSGKSTLINGMINYILGVKWEDEFRFKLIDEGESKSQAESQTSHVTAYEINYQDGFQISYSLTIIDTPGFGDTRGIDRDRQITEQIRTFFTPGWGISEIDAVCFVAQASLARLTHAQKYVLDAVLSIFGKDIAENIQMLVTFADGQRPPVLEAINVSGVPCPKKNGLPVHFKFNNSALFADNTISDSTKNSDEEDKQWDDNFHSTFWRVGMGSMKNFFMALTKMETKSLKLTKEVLKERKQLETEVEGLQLQIRAGLVKLEKIKETQQMIQNLETEISANKKFEFEVGVIKPVQVSIAGSGNYITNCQICHVTCHHPCNIPNHADIYRCPAMDSNGQCRVCPGKCQWSVHFNQKYGWKYKQVKKKMTYADLKAKYKKAYGAKMTAEKIIEKQNEEILKLHDEVLKLMDRSSKYLTRLQEISLKPNPLFTPQYIDLLIEGEKSEAKPGFLERIRSLEAMKEEALIIEKVAKKEDLLPKEMKAYN